jgi:hypothetical protein
MAFRRIFPWVWQAAPISWPARPRGAFAARGSLFVFAAAHAALFTLFLGETLLRRIAG